MNIAGTPPDNTGSPISHGSPLTCCMPTVTDIYPTMASPASSSGTHDCTSCTSCTTYDVLTSPASTNACTTCTSHASYQLHHLWPPHHFLAKPIPQRDGCRLLLTFRPLHSHICSAIHLQFGLSSTMQGNRALSMKTQKLPNLTSSLAGTHQSYIHSSSAASWPLTGPASL